MKPYFCLILVALVSLVCVAQEQPAPAPQQPASGALVPAGTRIPLQLINQISTKNAHDGDQVYLQSAFPIVINNRVVIPPNSYVKGTITQAKRPGKISGKGELWLRFDSITLPNGVTREFRARVGAIDGSNADTLDKKEGKIVSDSSKGHDAATIAETTVAGTSVGAIAARSGVGAGIGAGAGLIAGLATVLLSRGPDAKLERGSTVDMVLDRDLSFTEAELNFAGTGNIKPSNMFPSAQQPSEPQSPVINPGRLPVPIPR